MPIRVAELCSRTSAGRATAAGAPWRRAATGRKRRTSERSRTAFRDDTGNQTGNQLLELTPVLESSGTRILVDHCGRPDPTAGLDTPGFRELLRWGKTGRAFVKLSGLAKASREPYPHDDLNASTTRRSSTCSPATSPTPVTVSRSSAPLRTACSASDHQAEFPHAAADARPSGPAAMSLVRRLMAHQPFRRRGWWRRHPPGRGSRRGRSGS
ncbi:amidohydrolase family protein [Amycolatopsis sp. MEPSY49]|uniref:amidohydrolase family protein n=1 Tax=Amycolatopsis sp. MEPSY49 TaxID=3151600 RepID=UPI003F50E421